MVCDSLAREVRGKVVRTVIQLYRFVRCSASLILGSLLTQPKMQVVRQLLRVRRLLVRLCTPHDQHIALTLSSPAQSWDEYRRLAHMQHNIRIPAVEHACALRRPRHDLELLNAPGLGPWRAPRGLPYSLLVARVLADTFFELAHT